MTGDGYTITIDTADLDAEAAATVTYALHVRDHIAAARAVILDALAEDEVDPDTARHMTLILDAVDDAVLTDIGHAAGLNLPDGYTIGDTMPQETE